MSSANERSPAERTLADSLASTQLGQVLFELLDAQDTGSLLIYGADDALSVALRIESGRPTAALADDCGGEHNLATLLLPVFGWSDGRFEFVANEDLVGEHAVLRGRLDPLPLITIAARACTREIFIEQAMEGIERSLIQKSRRLDADRYGFTVEERCVLVAIELGLLELDDIRKQAGVSERVLRRVLYVLALTHGISLLPKQRAVSGTIRRSQPPSPAPVPSERARAASQPSAKSAQPAPSPSAQPAPRASQPNVRAPSQPNVRAQSQPNLRAQSQPGVRPPSQPGVRPPSQPGVRPPSQPGVRPPSQPNVRAPSQPGVRAPSQSGVRAPSQSNVRAPSQPGPRASQPGPRAPSQPNMRASQPSARVSQPGMRAPSQPGIRPPQPSAYSDRPSASPEPPVNDLRARREQSEGIWRRVDMLASRGDFGAALDAVHEAIKVFPPTPEQDAILGWLMLQHAGGHESVHAQVWRCLDRAFKRDPLCEQVLYYKGLVLNLTGDVEQAQVEFQRVLMIKPDHPGATREIRIYEMRKAHARTESSFLRRLLTGRPKGE